MKAFSESQIAMLCYSIQISDQIIFRHHIPIPYTCACGKQHSICRHCGQPLQPGTVTSAKPFRLGAIWIGFTDLAEELQACWMTRLLRFPLK